MLYNICNDDIYDGDDINCMKCNSFMHFGCASLRETTFRKMSKASKQKWLCNSCKYIDPSVKKSEPSTSTILEYKDMECLTNENFKNLIDSVNFMSEKFDGFGKQLQELITSIKDMKEENQILKEQNSKLKSDIVLLDKRMNILEQKAIENYVEIMGVPEANNEKCVKIVESIAKSVGVKTTVIKAFRIKSKINNKSRKIIAELQSKQIKK